MATGFVTSGPDENRTIFGVGREHRPPSAAVPHFRYGLRQLFVFVAAICALLAAIASMNGVFALVLGFASAIIAMHVFATSLGHRLRAKTDEEQLQLAMEANGNHSNPTAAERTSRIAAIRSAPRSPWHGRGCTYLPWLRRLTIGAMVLGGVAGSLLLSGLIGQHTSPAGIIVGAISFAVLGGWIAFLGGNFYGVFRHGFREALAEQQADQRARGADISERHS